MDKLEKEAETLCDETKGNHISYASGIRNRTEVEQVWGGPSRSLRVKSNRDTPTFIMVASVPSQCYGDERREASPSP